MFKGPSPSAHHHPDPLRTLAPHLLPHLPHTLPLLRRLQHQPPSPTSLVLATFPPSIPTSPPIPIHFAALYLDRASAPDTECWLFSTKERGKRAKSGHLDLDGSRAKRYLFALLGEIAKLDTNEDVGRMMVVGSLNEELLGFLGGEEVWPLKAEKVLTEARDGYTDRARSWLERERRRLTGAKDGGWGVVAGISARYSKWIIESPQAPLRSLELEEGNGQSGGTARDAEMRIVQPSRRREERLTATRLPDGYSFGHVKTEELDVVVKRSGSHKSEQALAGLGSVAVRYIAQVEDTGARQGEENTENSGTLIAWTFVDVDGSLVNMHVDQEHQDKGLAEAMLSKSLNQMASDPLSLGFRQLFEYNTKEMEQGEAPLHCDVAKTDPGVIDFVKPYIGEQAWAVRWVKMDLDRVQMVMKKHGWS